MFRVRHHLVSQAACVALTLVSATVSALVVGPTGAAATAAASTAPAAAAYKPWPSTKNTGFLGTRAPTRTIRGRTVTVDGTVIANVRVAGELRIQADNVRISNVYLESQGYYGVLTYGRNTVITDSTIRGTPGNTLAGIAAYDRGTVIARRVEVTRAEDGVRLGNNSVLVDSLVHGLAGDSSAHFDAVTADGHTGWRIVHNMIRNHHNQTAAVWVGDPRYGPSEGLLENNYIAGGGYSIYAGHGTGAGIRVRNNVFSARYFPRCGYFGVVAKWQYAGNTWSGNRWQDGRYAGRTVGP